MPARSGPFDEVTITRPGGPVRGRRRQFCSTLQDFRPAKPHQNPEPSCRVAAQKRSSYLNGRVIRVFHRVDYEVNHVTQILMTFFVSSPDGLPLLGHMYLEDSPSSTEEGRHMKRPLGPTVARWGLGETLLQARRAAGLEREDAARRLGCSVSKVQNIENGESRIVIAELEKLLSIYGVTDPEQVERCMELRQLGTQRGWWSKYGRLPKPFMEFLGIESAAKQIEIFEPLMITGLMQTRAYALAHEAAVTPEQTAEQVEKQVNLRMDRQKQVLKPDDRPEIWVVYDESEVLPSRLAIEIVR
ncbi:helix-turn-helix domain-containing protein, partial [Glycomyces buryatensis]